MRNTGSEIEIRTPTNGFGDRHATVTSSRNKLAGPLGIEPRTTESKSVVMPLHHEPIKLFGADDED